MITPYFHDPTVFERFVMYCSDQAHSSVEKGAMLSAVRMRKLKATRGFLGNYGVSRETLQNAIKVELIKLQNHKNKLISGRPCPRLYSIHVPGDCRNHMFLWSWSGRWARPSLCRRGFVSTRWRSICWNICSLRGVQVLDPGYGARGFIQFQPT